MTDFLTSGAGMAMILILGIVGLVGYCIICFVEAMMMDEFDPVCEQKCRSCICYNMCKEHGCHYDCKDYMTEEMLQKKGMSKDESDIV